MRLEAIRHAKERLERARTALATIKEDSVWEWSLAPNAATPTTQPDPSVPFRNLSRAAACWNDFLLAVGTIYSKIEQGSKRDKISKAWFDRKRHERRSDPLLSYLHHARITVEHDITDPVRLVGIRYVSTDPRVRVVHKIQDGRVHTGVLISECIPAGTNILQMKPPELLVARVYDARGRRFYEPPQEHLGQLIDDLSVLTIGGLALAYMERLVGEAEGFVGAGAPAE